MFTFYYWGNVFNHLSNQEINLCRLCAEKWVLKEGKYSKGLVCVCLSLWKIARRNWIIIAGFFLLFFCNFRGVNKHNILHLQMIVQLLHSYNVLNFNLSLGIPFNSLFSSRLLTIFVYSLKVYLFFNKLFISQIIYLFTWFGHVLKKRNESQSILRYKVTLL